LILTGTVIAKPTLQNSHFPSTQPEDFLLRSTIINNSALLALRAAIAFIFLWHGIPKAIDWPFAIGKFAGWGLPGFLGPVTGVVEVIAATMLVVGIFHRWAAIALGVIIVGAIATVQIPGGFSSGLERDIMILVGTYALFAFGSGDYALAKD
jgi:putative oxidoreductase